MSIFLNCLRIFFAKFSGKSGSKISPSSTKFFVLYFESIFFVFLIFFLSLEKVIIFAPYFAKSSAQARPIPCDPPDIKIFFFLN